MRYQAFAHTGLLMFEGESAQLIADNVANHMSSPNVTPIAYTVDTCPGSAYPYATWAHDGRHVIGTQHRNRPE